MKTSRHLTYHQLGRGKEAIFLHPSLGVGRFLFHRIAPMLARSYTVVTWDPRGVGDNQHLAPRLDEWIQDVCDLVEVVDRPAHLLGVSMGTWVMARAAVKLDAAVKKVILQGTTIRFSQADQAIADRKQELAQNSMAVFAKRYVGATLQPHVLPEVQKNLEDE
ncbi:MAG: alpha/beta hydrolase, partial [Firmicutes bacterium]|nr:alpha/beta hydrolase [Bacillota bacterium]